jgi:O-antigen/teichoic acid export membrane protein
MWLGQVLLLRQQNGVIQVGYFAFSYRWYLFVLFFASALSPVGLPVLTNLRATASADSNARFFRINLYATLLLAAIPAGILILFAGSVATVGGAGYRPVIPTVIVLAAACVPTALNTVLSQAALSMDRVRIWVISDIVLAVSLALVALLLVPRLGSLGLAYAYLSGMVATCLVLVVPVSPRLRGMDTWRSPDTASALAATLKGSE